ncbi:MAG: integrase core domain-containing protein [Breznakia sp.]
MAASGLRHQKAYEKSNCHRSYSTTRGKHPDIIHSDRGYQYRSYVYQVLLEKHHIQHSMSESRTPVDNAVIASYHRSIKRELIILNRHKTMAEMKVHIEEYLSKYYPNKRIHTKLKMTPRKFEENLLMSSNLL